MFRIVHSYFFQFNIYVDNFDISLRVAAKTRTKTNRDRPAALREMGEKDDKMMFANSIYSWSIRETNPYTALMADIHIDVFDDYHYPAQTKH